MTEPITKTEFEEMEPKPGVCVDAEKIGRGVKMKNKLKPLSDGEFEECKAYWKCPHNRYAIGAIGHIALEDIARLIATIEELKEHHKELAEMFCEKGKENAELKEQIETYELGSRGFP